MQIQRMSFIQHDPQSGTSQVLFLLRSGHDLELECQIRDSRDYIVDEPVQLAFTLNDKLVNQLDRQSPNSVESYDAWRRVVAECLSEPGCIVNGLIGLAAIVEFGEPCWQLNENLTIVDRNILQVTQVYRIRG